MDHMLPMLDGDLTKIGVAHMKNMGMEFHLECPVQSVETSPVRRRIFDERACPGMAVRVRVGKVNPLYNEISIVEAVTSE